MTQPPRPGPHVPPHSGLAAPPPLPQPRTRLSARGRELVGLTPFVGVSLLLFVAVEIVAVVLGHGAHAGQTLAVTAMSATAGALFACAVALTLHARSLDVSIFGTVALCDVVFVAVGGAPGLVIALVVALAAGIVNAALAGLLRLHSVAVTLGTGAVMAGIALAALHGRTLMLKDVLPAAFPTVVLVLIVLAAVGLDIVHLVGRTDERTPEWLRHALAHVAAALLAGLGAVVQATVVRSTFTDTGVSVLIAAIAAAFLGGTSASGHSRSLVGAVLAAAFLGAASVVIAIAGMNSYVDQVVVGVVLVLAVGGDRLRDLLLTPKASTPPRPAFPAQ